MGIVFSESSGNTGLVELLNRLTGTGSATTSSYPLAEKTRDINSAYAYFNMLQAMSDSRGQSEDTNQSKYPIITLNIVSGQQDYNLTVDGESTPNQILDVMRVECKDASGNWNLLYGYDYGEERNALSQNAITAGTPTRYDKYANALWLDKVPNYNSANGLKIYVSRTPSYFTISDTTKKPGIPDMFHEYLAYRPAFLYCLPKLPELAKNYLVIVEKFENDIAMWYGGKNRDIKKRMRPLTENCR